MRFAPSATSSTGTARVSRALLDLFARDSRDAVQQAVRSSVAANVVHAPTCFIRAASSNLRCGSPHNIRVIDGGIAEARPFYWDAAEIVAACAALDGQARDVHPQQTEGQRVVVGDLANRRDAGRLRCSFQLGCRRIGAVQNEL